MSRQSSNEYKRGYLWNGYDYTRQAWVFEGFYVSCGHAEVNPLTGKTTPCTCYGRKHAGELSKELVPEFSVPATAREEFEASVERTFDSI